MQRRRIGSGLTVLAAFLLLGGQDARATNSRIADLTHDADWIVDDDSVQCPNADYAHLQDAVDAAQAGEVVAVCPGLYEGTITITPDKTGLTLRGGQTSGDSSSWRSIARNRFGRQSRGGTRLCRPGR